MATDDSTTLVHTLAHALNAQLIETHISWVLLTADLAYKIKKPIRLSFIDYGNLQARQHFCEEEVRLNQRLAPSLYLGVTRITGTPQLPVLDGAGPVLEYAVRMRRFSDGSLFSEKIAAGALTAEHIDSLAALLADFHVRAARADANSGLASADQRLALALNALHGVQAIASRDEYTALLAWLQAQGAALAPLWALRLAQGHVRECHGDLHLANVIAQADGVAAFDGIEFDPALRWIDVLDDIAFTVMDLWASGRHDFSFRFLNGWLDRTGEHAGLPVLRFAVVYRALVRAMVARLGGGAGDATARRYLDTALAWTKPGSVRLFITHGLPGSGKTFASQGLLEQAGAIRLRSDVERKRLYGLGMHEDSNAQGLSLYDAQASARTYAHLFSMARAVLLAGYPVILDAAFLRREQRSQALALARELGVPLIIVACEAPAPVLRERLLARKGDASEADVAVLEKLQTRAEVLTGEELALSRTPEQLMPMTAKPGWGASTHER